MIVIMQCCLAALIGVRKHHSVKPLLIALAGSGIISYTMLVSYSTLAEIAGFLILAMATYIDYDRRRWARVKGGKKAVRAQRSSHESNTTTGPDISQPLPGRYV